ncbi:MAG: FecR domain-containing protein [Acidobacteria bacterium]|nr:FecR domain-containing protein [Acidobacteriota bacterium]
MRSRLSAPAALLFLLSVTFLQASPALADDVYDDEYEERARVLRVSLLKGEVSVKRSGEDDWEETRLNAPLVEGDLLATGRDSRLEIQVDARNFVRLGPDSVLKIVTLRDEGIALSLSEGTATVRLARFDKDKEYFELDAPATTVAAEKTGLYRLDVDRDGTVRGRTARLTGGVGGVERDWEFTAAAGFDAWDSWNDERERYLASRLRHEGRERYYDSDIYGAEELDAYGDWVYTNDYGYIWRPHTTVVNVYNDWAPYRYGRWVWCPPYGWTWVADEPWGWAPYHYGRWVHVNGRWCWAPRGYGYSYRRAWWRPALVVFVAVDYGRDRQYCWYPLTYGQRDPRGRWWSRRYDPVTPLRGRDLERLRRSNPALLRAVTTASVRDFGAATLRARPASGDIAQRALKGEPVRGQLPIARAGSTRGVPRADSPAGAARPAGANGRDTLTINRPAPAMPPRVVPDRPTGAAARTPGVPLDGELRRTRVFNNREPRVPNPSAPGGDSAGSGSSGRAPGGDTGTGAVERPRSTGSSPSSPGGFGGEATSPARARPSRPSTPVEPGGSPNDDEAPSRRRDPNDDSTRRVRPTRPPDERPRDDGSNSQRIPRYEPRIRPRDEGERQPPPARREEPSPRRDDTPSYRPEPSAPHESPRSEPRREEPRRETPRPEPRQEAPRPDPPRQEAPRQDPPRQEAPRQEAPRQEAPRQEAPGQEAPRPNAPRRGDRP